MFVYFSLGNSNDHKNSWYYINIYAWLPSILLLAIPFIYAKAIDNKFQYVQTVLGIQYAIMLFLILLCFWIILKLTKTDYHEMSVRQFMSLDYMFNLSLKVFMVAACSWTIGFFSILLANKRMNILNTFLECVDYGSGIGIFFVLIYWRPRVKKLLANRRVLGISMPSHWATLEQVE
ncbi:unnamed protein product [Diamesa tonsa]